MTNKNVRKNGTAAVYYNLQYTHKGKNHSFAIPVDKVEDFKAAITAGRKLKDLVLELSLANARELHRARRHRLHFEARADALRRHERHYPFDDRLGLVGRNTPAAADEEAGRLRGMNSASFASSAAKTL